MTDSIFERFSPIVQEFIYKNEWRALRPVQTEAAKAIFDSDDNLILSSGTASGKTEAAFFPIISMMGESPEPSVEVLYIAPLKSLINDQFRRIDELLDESGIPVYRWHGDVASSHKTKLLKDPRGVLQITPESLESMLMSRKNDIPRIFGHLRFVVIDEIHTLMGSDRGNQILCQLDRIAALIGYAPRRIGLSATIGDIDMARKWLSGNSGRDTRAPRFDAGKTSWRLALEHFYIQDATLDRGIHPAELPQEEKPTVDAGYEYVYNCTKDRRALVFSNSREETEYVTATLHQIAKRRGDKDNIFIHHGNLSASIREETEDMLREGEPCTACATVTLELGIDIGALERIVNIGAPTTVAGFLQRLGRSGRRGDPPEMFLVCREEMPLPDTPLPQLIPWEMIRAIAVIQLYIEEKFIEPIYVKKLPLSLLFQQTLSILSSSGELTPKALAERVLTLSPFKNVDKEDYRTLVVSMVKNNYIEMTEEGGLIVGIAGEKLTKSFKFYAVFKDDEDYSVKCESTEIGTISSAPPIGDRFALAGRVWEVEETDITRRLIYVHGVEGKMEISWPGDYGEIHTRILERMLGVLSEDTVYPYLHKNAIERLTAARNVARHSGMTEKMLISLGGNTLCLFPWLGTRSFRTMRKFLAKNAKELGISKIEYDGCNFITFKSMSNADDVLGKINRLVSVGFTAEELVSQSECPTFDKYDALIPSELLRRAYALDKLRVDEIARRFS
ncbi:MAG: DEAD/DEAH box helicase [Clostridia bacterium]|nr:DEAD/DEAH box helicase [Clostridia bacterium]